MIDKSFQSSDTALFDIFDGASIMIGGFGTAGMPESLLGELITKGARNLTIINNYAGNGEIGLAALLNAGQAGKIVCSFPRQVDSHHFDRLIALARLNWSSYRRAISQHVSRRPALVREPSSHRPAMELSWPKAKKRAV